MNFDNQIVNFQLRNFIIEETGIVTLMNNEFLFLIQYAADYILYQNY